MYMCGCSVGGHEALWAWADVKLFVIVKLCAWTRSSVGGCEANRLGQSLQSANGSYYPPWAIGGAVGDPLRFSLIRDAEVL